MSYTTGDELEDRSKQSSIDFLYKNLKEMMLEGTDGSLVEEDLYDISSNDIDNYMDSLSTSNTLPIKAGRIRFVVIEDIDLLFHICDFMQVSFNSIPKIGQQRVYFIDSGDFCATFIPLETEKNHTRILIQPFEDSSLSIQALKWELEAGRKSIKNFDELKKKFDYRKI